MKIYKEIYNAFSWFDNWKSKFGESPYNKTDLIDYEGRKRHYHRQLDKKVKRIIGKKLA